MRLFALIVAALVLATAQAAAKEPLAPKIVFGVVWNQRNTSFAKLDARTLKPVSKVVPLGVAASYLGRSPGRGGRAAFAVGEEETAIAFVDLAKMKREGRVALPCGIRGPIVWQSARRLVATCASSASSVLVVDPVARKVVARRPLSGEIVTSARGAGRLVALTAPLGSIGDARLVVVDGAGRARTVALPGVRAGTEVLDQNNSRFREEIPAIAVDSGTIHAAVVPASGPVTVVDLQTLAIAKHTLAARSLSAAAKNVEGTVRTALWTGGGMIAVAGTNANGDAPDHWTPAGLTLIDSRTWTTKLVDPRAVSVAAFDFGTGILSSATVWDGQAHRSVGDGLRAYGGDGSLRFHLFAGEPVDGFAIVGSYVYVPSSDFRRYRIVDTRSGRVVASPRSSRAVTIASA
jgi:hypothetical protein